MKCIRNIKKQTITRVSDQIASEKVQTGKFEYCGKEAWKKMSRK